MSIGSSLRDIRRMKHLSQENISLLTGLTQQYVSRIEKGNAATLDTIEKYAKALNQSIVLEDANIKYSPSPYLANNFLSKKYLELSSSGMVILSHVAAAEALGLFVGILGRFPVEYYAMSDHECDNTIFHYMQSPLDVGYVISGGIRCTDAQKTINDLLSAYDRIDIAIILEALNTYYYMHNQSFNGLLLSNCNIDIFDSLKDEAISL